MNTATLEQVLAATGYLPDGQPAPGLRLGAEAQSSRHGRVFVPDALWRSASSLTVYFKFEQSAPADAGETVAGGGRGDCRGAACGLDDFHRHALMQQG